MDLPASLPMRVVVADARQVEETRLGVKSQFTMYCINSGTNQEGSSFRQQTVWRRFRDFEALHKLLHASQQGYFIPPLPGKNFIQAKMANAEFVQMRKAELSRFLRGLVAHPFLCDVEELSVFLGMPRDLCSSPEWHDVVQRANASNAGPLSPRVDGGSPSTTSGMFAKRRSMGSPMKKQAIKSKHIAPEDELHLRQAGAKLRQLEPLLRGICEQAQNFVHALEEALDAHLEMGTALITFARYEDRVGTQCGQYTETGSHSASRASTLQKAGYTSLKVHQVCRRFANMMAGSMAPLHVQLNLVPSALVGLEDREHGLDAVHRVEGTLERKRLRLEELIRDSAKKLGGVAASTMRSAGLEAEIRSLECDVERLTGEYKVIKDRNQAELLRYREARHAALIGMGRNLAQVQVELNESAAEAWRTLAEQLEKATATNEQ